MQASQMILRQFVHKVASQGTCAFFGSARRPLTTLQHPFSIYVFKSTNKNVSKPEARALTFKNRLFHATPSRPFAERRRRRRRGVGAAIATGDEDDKEGNNKFQDHKPITDPTEFEKQGQALLEKLELSVEGMKAINYPFRVNRDADSLTIEIDPANGSYVVELDNEEKVITFRSPISGLHSYFCSNKDMEWVDVVDHHSFEGMFVRDLIRICKGVPKL